MATATKLGVERQPGEVQCSRLFEQHFSPAELADEWNLSEDTVRRIFERESDFLIFEDPARRSSRRRRTLRIPESVAERVHRRLSTRTRCLDCSYRRSRTREAKKWYRDKRKAAVAQ